MKYNLDTSVHAIRFSVLVSTSRAELEGSDHVVGERTGSRRLVNRARSVTEEFLNCGSDAQSILSFTCKYGPLRDPPGRERFQFDLANWRNEQKRLRGWWDMFALVSKDKSTISSRAVETVPHECFRIDSAGLTFECASLSHYMVLEIAALPSERIRICQREGCRSRFFANDLREKYCSESCKAVERNKAKLRYWNEHKQEFLAERMKRRKAVRGKNNVTRKTR
jgi:hypothetical protein